MRSVFAASSDFFHSLLGMAHDEDLGDHRFPCRNYLLEAGVPSVRVDGYLTRSGWPVASTPTADAFRTLNGFHNSYIEDRVFRGVRTSPIDTRSADCPETFQSTARLDEYGETDSDLLLVRLEPIQFIADMVGYDADALTDLFSTAAGEVRGEHLSADTAARCNAVLARWQDCVDARPLFCGFWEEARAVLEEPDPGWANELRDRLGLLHYNPDVLRPSGIPVAAFRYNVSMIPRSAPGGPRLLVRPSVLDGRLNAAFYTAPAGSPAGATVDLCIRDDEPWQELVHPAVEFTAENLWAVDVITTSVEEPLLATRAYHALKVCDSADQDFVDLCMEVDGDII